MAGKDLEQLTRCIVNISITQMKIKQLMSITSACKTKKPPDNHPEALFFNR